jgi:hypothetical protein
MGSQQNLHQIPAKVFDMRTNVLINAQKKTTHEKIFSALIAPSGLFDSFEGNYTYTK